LGGYREKRQVSHVEDCQLIRDGSLPFDFQHGACGVYSDTKNDVELVLMCFHDKRSNQDCWTFDADPELAEKVPAISQYDHHQIALANYIGYPIAVGSMTHAKAEIFDFTTGQWIMVPNYPFERSFYHYATVSTDNAAYFMGGFGSREQTRIARFIGDEWEELFDLQYARHGHAAIYHNHKILQIGGEGERYTELTYRPIENGDVESVLVGKELSGYYAYPVAYVVPRDYCQPNVY